MKSSIVKRLFGIKKKKKKRKKNKNRDVVIGTVIHLSIHLLSTSIVYENFNFITRTLANCIVAGFI